MGPKKPRPANKRATKGKRQAWRKGQCSSYNPKSTKYRDQAKQRASHGYQPNSGLTETALAVHNKSTNASEDITDFDYAESAISSEKSFVSTFSNCSNPAFDSLLKRWRSNSFLHKEMLAVLAAVTEVIKQKGGKETETEYFAALMTSLDVAETDEAKTAVLSLLHIVVRRLPESILKLNFSKACPLLKDVLLKYADSDFNALLRNTLGCLYCFLKAQDLSSWNENSRDVFNFILGFTVHNKPKVRKAAQSAAVSLLKFFTSECPEGSVHPACSVASQFCISQLESSGISQSSNIFYILNMLGHIMFRFPRSCLKSCCETILRIMTLGGPLVVASCLKALLGLFGQKPKAENLSDELNVRIIKALYDYQPNINDANPLSVWLMVLENAFINLFRLNPQMCLSHLPHFFKSATACWRSNKEEVYPAVSLTLTNLIHNCLDPSNPEFQQLMMSNPIDNPVQKMFQHVEGSLSYQYHRAWRQVLLVMAAFFEVTGKHCHSFMMRCLQSLADLRETHKFPYIAELDRAVGAAIRKMGPRVVLKAIPLVLDADEGKLDFPRSWLLPLLRDNVRETELGFFIRFFLPFVSRVHEKFVEFKAAEKVVEAKTYEVINSQIWSLLPGFCTKPTDLPESFRAIAKILGTTLNEQPQWKITILKSLRILISQNLENAENRAELSKYAKNFLPILFNLYTTESKDKFEESIRLSVFDTIKEYLKISEGELCEKFFVNAMAKLKDATSFLQQSLLDIMKALSPYIPEYQIRELYEHCKPLLQDTNHTVQKKSYGIINEICGAQMPGCISFVKNNMEDLKSLLLTSLSGASAPSKAMRLSCLIHIINHLGEENKSFIVAVVPEAVLCTKETAVRTRKMAFKLLKEIGICLKKWKPEDPKGAIEDYFQMLLAGFVGSPHMMSATLLAVAHVLFEFKADLDSKLIHLLLENVCLLLTARSREVVSSALSFIKVLFIVVDSVDLAQHVEYLVKALASISEDYQRHFRFRAKELFTRLVRKFGYEMISKLAPERIQKQLTNIRKIEARKVRQKSSDDNGLEKNVHERQPKEALDVFDELLKDSDDESDIDDEDVPAARGKQKRGGILKKPSTWIAESADSEIVDFMDPSVSRKILAAKPVKERDPKKKQKVTFNVGEDGRIVIPDEKTPVLGKRKRGNDEDTPEQDGSSRKKKKKAEDSSEDEDDKTEQENQTLQKPILRGIHRNVVKKEKPPGVEFRAKKAGGDMKKGKFDPYAYIPLNSKFLNKRKHKKLEGQFKGIVRAAKRGAEVGSKKKSRNIRKKR